MNLSAKDNTLEFIDKASLVSAKVHRVKDMASALDMALALCQSKPPCESQMEPVRTKSDPMSGEKTRIIAAPNLSEDDFTRFYTACQKAGDILLIRENLRAYPGGIDMGLTRVNFGIAETGTLVLNSDSEETRLSTMLCETHVAILEEQKIRETALSMAGELNDLVQCPSSYTAFITGASRTADIERVLALGVHGPLELVILLVEA
ncbi:MAG: lactate utilization protein [Proteobacteria bacterium]|nr:lactate utilization protein [Desulfobacula sp.]MBU3952011.1 lactate utilization protein [Pseudomonadota bacterium]MBU4130604.1 lactate utilization protein [Pseudomonadota bacterium]